MDATKRFYQNLGQIFLFSYLALFPFGQLIRLEFDFKGISFPVHPLDLIAALSMAVVLLGRFSYPKVFREICAFISVSSLSLAISFSFLTPIKVFYGSLYLIRFISYTFLFVLVWNLLKTNKLEREKIYKSLILTSFSVSVFGLVQYFWIPDLTSLKYVGWDDHLLRLVGTFLDPGFTAVIIVFGLILAISWYLKFKGKLIIFVIIIFLISLLLTYSRAGYLAFIFGLIAILFRNKNKKLLILIAIIFIAIIPILPRLSGEGVRLERSNSIIARINNYRQTLKVFNDYPLFGVGFNNLCSLRLKDISAYPTSHSCSGSDSSMLLVLATTGIVGFFIFLYMSYKILKSLFKDFYKWAFLACSTALFIHAIFLNSLFYPWVMGFMGILLAISIKE